MFALLGEQAEPRIAQAVALARAEVLQYRAADAPELAQSFYRYLLFDNSAAEVRVSLSPRPAAPVGDIAAVSERLPGNLHAMVPRNWAAKSVEDLWRDGHALDEQQRIADPAARSLLLALTAHAADWQRLDWVLREHGDYAGLAFYLERLSPAQRGVLELLALLDESLPTADFAALYPAVRLAVAELPEADPAAHLPELQQQALLYRDESGHYDTYPTLRTYLQQQQNGKNRPVAQTGQ